MLTSFVSQEQVQKASPSRYQHGHVGYGQISRCVALVWNPEIGLVDKSAERLPAMMYPNATVLEGLAQRGEGHHALCNVRVTLLRPDFATERSSRTDGLPYIRWNRRLVMVGRARLLSRLLPDIDYYQTSSRGGAACRQTLRAFEIQAVNQPHQESAQERWKSHAHAQQMEGESYCCGSSNIASASTW